MEQKRIHVIIINGKGGCGKDTLIDNFSKEINFCKIFNESAIDHVRDILTAIGIKEDKSNKKYRALLAAMKEFLDSDVSRPQLNSTTILINKITDCNSICERNNTYGIVFVHIREPENIKLLKHALECIGYDKRIHTLLVKSKRTEDVSYGNPADDEVNNYNYDAIFINDKPLEESKKYFSKTILSLFFDTMYKIGG